MSDEQDARDLLGDDVVEKALDSGWLPRDERPNPKYGTASYDNGFDCGIEGCQHRFRYGHGHNWDIDIMLARPIQLVIGRDPHTLAHANGVDTEHEAAIANQAGKATNRVAVLIAISRSPRSTAEIHDSGMLQMERHEIARRASDLLNQGLVERMDETDGYPRPGHRLRITQAGRDVLAALKEPTNA